MCPKLRVMRSNLKISSIKWVVEALHFVAYFIAIFTRFKMAVKNVSFFTFEWLCFISCGQRLNPCFEQISIRQTSNLSNNISQERGFQSFDSLFLKVVLKIETFIHYFITRKAKITYDVPKNQGIIKRKTFCILSFLHL